MSNHAKDLLHRVMSQGAFVPPIGLFHRAQYYATDHALLQTAEDDRVCNTGEHADRLLFRPVSIGRVPGISEVSLHQALSHVLAEDVCTRLPVPNWPLAKVSGYAICTTQWQQASQAKALKVEETIIDT